MKSSFAQEIQSIYWHHEVVNQLVSFMP